MTWMKRGLSFEFNTWGDRYDPFNGDNAAAKVILNSAAVPIYRSSLIAEGGGIPCMTQQEPD